MKTKIDKLLDNIENIKKKREERRKINSSIKSQRENQKQQERIIGNFFDSNFYNLMQKQMFKKRTPQSYIQTIQKNIIVCVRKRPLLQQEIQKGMMDCVDVINPKIRVL